MYTVYARYDNRYFKLSVSPRWAQKNDNGALISCGLTVGVDLKESQLKALIQQGKAVEVTEEERNHSGCLSSCINRGNDTCRW